MHSWGLYNGRYGLSDHVLIKQFPEQERPLAERMLDGELARQKRLKEEIGKDPKLADRLDEKKLFQNYKQLQFIDTLALYFNRVHPSERGPQTFEHVPRNVRRGCRGDDRAARKRGVYTLSPFPFAPDDAEFAFAGRRVSPREHEANGIGTRRCSSARRRSGSVPARSGLGQRRRGAVALLSSISLVELGNLAEAHQLAELAELVERNIAADARAVIFQLAIDVSQRLAGGEKAEGRIDRDRIPDLLQRFLIRDRRAPALDHIGHKRPIESSPMVRISSTLSGLSTNRMSAPALA